jgi:hypothetical protein
VIASQAHLLQSQGLTNLFFLMFLTTPLWAM